MLTADFSHQEDELAREDNKDDAKRPTPNLLALVIAPGTTLPESEFLSPQSRWRRPVRCTWPGRQGELPGSHFPTPGGPFPRSLYRFALSVELAGRAGTAVCRLIRRPIGYLESLLDLHGSGVIPGNLRRLAGCVDFYPNTRRLILWRATLLGSAGNPDCCAASRLGRGGGLKSTTLSRNQAIESVRLRECGAQLVFGGVSRRKDSRWIHGGAFREPAF